MGLAEVSTMVAAMFYAWMQENTTSKAASDTWHAVPMIDIRRHLMHKHKDAVWLFDACGIDAESLLFADEVLHRTCYRGTCNKSCQWKLEGRLKSQH